MQALLAEKSVTGIERTSRGNAGFFTAPADMYRTLDGWITVQVIGHGMFARWAKLVGREELIEDPRFADDLLRADNREALTQVMEAWLSDRTYGASFGGFGRRAIAGRSGAGFGASVGRSASEGARVAAVCGLPGRSGDSSCGEPGSTAVGYAGRNPAACADAGRAHR